jgi:phospholipid/cholesterol/gamma-HCH transport system permease protein
MEQHPTSSTPERLPVRIGLQVEALKKELQFNITFLGEFFYQLFCACKQTRRIRWGDLFHFIEVVGPNALPITALLGFLFGLILSFQGVIPLQTFGADIYVIRLVGTSLVRELAPLLTAIIIVARTASAFAAEIGTMKINREIDALHTMGIESIRFLVLPRVLAVVFIMPALTIFLCVFSFLGCYIVSSSMGFTFSIFMNELYKSFTYTIILNSLLKSIVFGFLAAITGCVHGLKTSHGPSAVGSSTTNAVVSGIVVLALADGLFSVINYILWI